MNKITVNGRDIVPIIRGCDPETTFYALSHPEEKPKRKAVLKFRSTGEPYYESHGKAYRTRAEAEFGKD